VTTLTDTPKSLLYNGFGSKKHQNLFEQLVKIFKYHGADKKSAREAIL